jgi:hypothetical protein
MGRDFSEVVYISDQMFNSLQIGPDIDASEASTLPKPLLK